MTAGEPRARRRRRGRRCRGGAGRRLALAGVLLACGTERIELRPAPAEIVVEPAGAEIVPAENASTAAPVLMPGGNGVVLPEGRPAGDLRGCRKVDVLFVIDNSISMRDEQANLARSFPGFVRVMQQVLEADDFHMMVVSTSGRTEAEGDVASDPAQCAETRGAGRRASPDDEDCGIEGGLAYMTQDQPELESTFACAAQVGTGGSLIEEPMSALLAATSPELNAPGACNAGFLRDDAILVVTLITDEEDRSDAGPDEWRRVLLDAKHGDENALVVLGLVGDNNIDGGLWGGPCSLFDADAAPRLQDFVSGFGGVLGSVCSPDYTPFFQTAVGSIDGACEDFVPPVIL